MVYMIKEGRVNNIIHSEIIIENFSYLTKEDSFIIKKMFIEDNTIKRIKFPEKIIDLAIDIIVNNKEISILYNLLAGARIPLFSLVPVSTYKGKYEELKKFKSSKYAIITCNKNNLVRGLELAKKLNKIIVIDGTAISLKDYEEILVNYDMDSLDNMDIKINYQEQNSAIEIKELYKTALLVNNISKEIEKNNLSPLEMIIYSYDVVKERVYKECIEDKDSSRDLNQIVQNEYTVCVGYSNLFTATLRNLGINAVPLISSKTKHQRSLVYIKDEKYNIDGVYVFDVTFDRKRKEDYISNYDYFALTLNDSEKDCPSDIYRTMNISFQELLNLYSVEELLISKVDGAKEKEELLRRAFEFVCEDGYRVLEENARVYSLADTRQKILVKNIYNKFKMKYKPNEISNISLLHAIYAVRKIEFENNIIEELEIEEIAEVLKDRFISQRLRYCNIEDKYERLYKILEESSKLQDELEEEILQNLPVLKNQRVYSKKLKLSEE